MSCVDDAAVEAAADEAECWPAHEWEQNVAENHRDVNVKKFGIEAAVLSALSSVRGCALSAFISNS